MYKLENSDAEMLPRILAAYYVVALAASLMKHSAVCYRWVKILYYTSQYFFKEWIRFQKENTISTQGIAGNSTETFAA